MAKSKYETHVLPYLDHVRIWIAKGATQKEVAEKLHISRDSLNQYARKYPDFSDAIASPRGFADDQVEAALFKRATGYDYEEVTRWQTIGPGGQLIWLERRSQKHLPPDPGAAEFWLTNRRRAEWRRQPEVKQEEKAEESGVVMMPEVTDG